MYERFISSSMLTGTLFGGMFGGFIQQWGGCRDASCRVAESPEWLNIQIADVERVVFDELPTRLDLVTHQRGEHLIGFCMVFGTHLQERSNVGIHRRRPERLGVHLTEALITVDG